MDESDRSPALIFSVTGNFCITWLKEDYLFQREPFIYSRSEAKQVEEDWGREWAREGGIPPWGTGQCGCAPSDPRPIYTNCTGEKSEARGSRKVQVRMFKYLSVAELTFLQIKCELCSKTFASKNSVRNTRSKPLLVRWGLWLSAVRNSTFCAWGCEGGEQLEVEIQEPLQRCQQP